MHFAKIALDNGGSIHPLIIPASITNGTGLMNPSVYNDNGKIIINLKNYLKFLIQPLDSYKIVIAHLS